MSVVPLPAGTSPASCDPELRRLLAEARAVSFDFFDTLFTRPLAHPEDAFDILGQRHGIPDFRTRRQQAQAEAFRRMAQCGRKEIALADIYACFAVTAAEVSADELMQAEVALELALLEPIAEMLDLLLELHAIGMPVVITSDMYLTADFFQQALAGHGLGHLPVYASASCNATKRDHGELFDQVAVALGLPAAQLLHIGDNLLADVQRPRAKGWQAYHFRPGHLVHPVRPVKEASLATSLCYGLLQTRAHAVCADPHASLGFVFGGPATVGFLEWLTQRAREDRIDHVLFLSRDGYALDRLVRTGLGAGLPPSSYLLGSRTAFTLAAMTPDNFADFLPFLLSGAEGLAPHELLERIGVPAPSSAVMRDLGLADDHRIDLRDATREARFLQAWRWEILKVCQRNRRALYHYLRQLGLTSGQRVAVVDVGWRGTTQEAFRLALCSVMDLDLFGYYFCLPDTPETRIRAQHQHMQALLDPATVPAATLEAVYRNRVAIELFFSAPHESVIGWQFAPDQSVEPVFDPGRGGGGNIAACSRAIVEGIEMYASLHAAEQRRLGVDLSPLQLARPMVELATGMHKGARQLIDQLQNFDTWSSSRHHRKAMNDYAI